MADISALGNLNSSEPLDFDTYVDAKEGFTLPPKGRYTVIAPETFPDEAFGATQAGFLSAQIDPTIVGPTGEGITLRFTKVSAKPFKRGTATVSQLGDYLRACGLTGRLSGDPAELASAVSATAGRVYEVDVDWRAYNKNNGYKVEGMTNFPSDGNGGHQSWCEDPTDKDPSTGKPTRLRANLQVKRFVPKA